MNTFRNEAPMERGSHGLNTEFRQTLGSMTDYGQPYSKTLVGRAIETYLSSIDPSASQSSVWEQGGAGQTRPVNRKRVMYSGSGAFTVSSRVLRFIDVKEFNAAGKQGEEAQLVLIKNAIRNAIGELTQDIQHHSEESIAMLKRLLV